MSSITVIIIVTAALMIGATITYLIKTKNKPTQKKVLSLKDPCKDVILNDNKGQSKERDSQTIIKTNANTGINDNLEHACENCISNTIDNEIHEVDNGKSSEISNLIIKIESLKDELEKKEDDISDLEKKVKNKESELSELRDEYNNEQKVSKKLYSDLALVREELDNKMAELKLKIETLNDELEEKEDDISDLEKKVKNKESDLSELRDEYNKEQKVSKKLYSDLALVREELDNKMAELKLKIESLDFIKEILSAKETSSEDIQSLYKNISVFESFVSGQFTECNSHLLGDVNNLWDNKFSQEWIANKQEYFTREFKEWAPTKQKNWISGKTTIAFVGEFSAGKTSIVNRILSQDNPDIPQLPVSAKASTAIPTYIVTVQRTTPCPLTISPISLPNIQINFIMARTNTHHPLLYQEYLESNCNTMSEFCREHQINYDNFNHYVNRIKQKQSESPFAPVVLGKVARSKHRTALITDIKICYQNGTSLHMGSVDIRTLEQVLKLKVF